MDRAIYPGLFPLNKGLQDAAHSALASTGGKMLRRQWEGTAYLSVHLSSHAPRGLLVWQV